LASIAKEAAEQGRWDLVGECYREREIAIAGASLVPQETERLLAIDRQIEERALVAQKALASLMHQSSAIRRRLKGLRQGIGALSADSGTIVFEA